MRNAAGCDDGWWLGYHRGCNEALFAEALLLLDGQPRQKVSQLQRRFRIGYNRASRLWERLERDLHARPSA